jgi:FkbM family methyltransferase
VTFFIGSPEFKAGRHYRTIVDQQDVCRFARVDLGTHVIHVLENDPTIGGTIIDTKTYEPHLAGRMSRALGPGTTFVDIGASVGFFTLLAATRVGSAGRVYAFEPSPVNCKLLSLSLVANSMANVAIFPAAVSDVEELLLYDAIGSNGVISTMPTDAGSANDLILRTIVRSVVLDRVLGDLDRLDVVKIDVEGAEYRALKGATGLLQAKRPLVFSEFAPVRLRQVSGVEPEEYLQLLVGIGYDVGVLQCDGSVTQHGHSCRAILEAHARSKSDHIDIVAFDPNRHIHVLS